MLEKQVQSKLIKHLESKGAYVIKTIATNKAGVPDVLCCYKGHFLGIEVKTPSTLHTLTPLQRAHLNMIRKAGGIAFVFSGDLGELNKYLGDINETFTTSN